jgi:CheY-like chemotaxis protein
MPEMDGFEFLRRVKANPDFQPIPVMMLTTEPERGKVIQAIQAGAVNYICKPFKPEDLAVKMAEPGCGALSVPGRRRGGDHLRGAGQLFADALPAESWPPRSSRIPLATTPEPKISQPHRFMTPSRIIPQSSAYDTALMSIRVLGPSGRPLVTLPQARANSVVQG